MTNEQIRWLQRFSRRWEENVDDTPAGRAVEGEMIEEYNQWLAENRLQPDPLANVFDDLEPDPTAVANAPDVLTLAAAYDIPPVTVREIQARFRDPEITLVDLRGLRDDAEEGAPGTIFENLPEESREGAASMLSDEIRRRALAENARAGFNRNEDLFQTAPQVPQAPAPRIQVQDPVPREMQTLNTQDLYLRLGPMGVSEARRIAQEYFDANVFNQDVPVSAATNAIRSYNFGPHEGQPPMVRELAARELEELFNTAEQDGSILANALDEAMYQDMDGPEEAMRAADRDISLLRRRGELAWEDVFGPLAEDYPWSRNTQERAIQNLQMIADEYRRQRDADRPFAKGGPVKKARTPMVVTRKSPELAEMQYRYGGIV